jgi:aryl-alcohol dehydrogenase-like predicted oxidoreductase
MTFLKLAEQNQWPKPVSIQNPYSLLNRSYEVGMAELSIRENCGLLAYSPLAMGMLTGKYDGGQQPANARLTVFHQFARYIGPRAKEAARLYNALAQAHALTPTQLALAFVNQQMFLTSNIIGATSLAQLKENIDTVSLPPLSPNLMAEIEAIHNEFTYPAP